MKEDHESCSTGSSLSGIYKNFFKSQTQPVCMFYFSHPFGISTPSSTNNADVKKKQKKGSKYTTTTYLVTEIQKNHSDGSQDEADAKKNVGLNDKDLLPWPKNFLLPPLIQLIEKKHGKKLPDIDAILRQVRKQAWNTPKSHHSHSFWSRGSSISSDDFSSLTSPELLIEKSFYTKKAKLKKKLKGAQNKAEKMSMNEKSNGSSGSGHGKSPTLLKRRYSVPEIIMRKYSLAQQKTYEESTSIYSTTAPTTEAITKRNGQINNHNKKPIQPQTPSSHTASPIKYFIPLSPQQSLNVVSSPTLSSCSFGGSGGFFHNTSEISMRKQTLLRRMWSREFQHTKYSGSWSPPLRKSTHHNTQSRLKKFNTLPEFLSSSCEKCRELGVLSRDNFDDESCENKEDKSQQTDFQYDVSEKLETQLQALSSASSSASTIIQSADIVGIEANLTTKSNSVGSQTTSIKNSSSSSITDANGNNIIICMTTLQQEQQISPDLQSEVGGNEDMLQVEIDTNNNNSNNNNVTTTTTVVDMSKNGDKYLKKQFSTQLEDEGYHPQEDLTNINYRRLREDKLNDTEIDQYISQMLIDNLNNVIKTVNENLQANGEHNLVKIDYNHPPSSGGVDDENVFINTNNKLRNQHEIAIQMRNAKNGDNSKNRNSNDSMSSPTNYTAVEHDICGNTDVNSPKLALEQFQNNLSHRHYFATSFVDSKSVSENSNTSTDLSDQLEITAVINTGTSYPLPNRPDSILVPRVIGPKTESMEVNPSSSSAQDDDELDGMPDSDDEDLISDVDSLDDVVTIRAKKLNELAHQQHRKAQALFRQTHLKGQAFFVPIVDTDQPIDEHIVVADTMPEKLKEKLVLRQRRRDMKKQSEMKMKQWKMQRFIERKMEHLNVVNDYLADLSTTGGAFKIIGMQSRQLPIETAVYKRASASQSGGGGGWVPKQRTAPPQITTQQSNESISEKSSKSKKLRNEIGMLESYKIDARGNMQIQAPKKEKEKPPKPKIKRTSYTSISDGKRSSKGKLKTPSESIQRKSVPSSKRMSSNIPTSSASSVEAIDARRRQIMKDVQQMSVYKNDLTPDPDSGPSRKMWKTEIQEGDKHIEILEIVECVDGNTLAQQAPENNNFNHLFTSSPSNNSQNHHKFYHVPSSSSSIPHSMFVNKTFSVKTSGFDDTGSKHYASRIPVPVYRPIRHYRQPFINYEPRDTSPSNNFSSSTDAEESLTSAGSSVNQHASKVDRMIANLLMEALKSPDDIGMDYIKSPKVRRMKRRSQSPGGGADSSSTGYYTGDSSSRRSASNSAGKYQHRFEVIPEEKSSFSVDSSNDDFIEDEEEETTRTEKINNINNDWKSKKNLQNNDIKTRNITPQRQSQSQSESDDDDEEEDKENADGKEEENEKCKTNKIPQPIRKSPSRAIVTPSNHVSSNNNSNSNSLKVPSSSIKSVKLSPAKSPSRSIKSNKSTIGADSSLSINASPSNKKDVTLMDVKTPTKTTADTKDASETKSFVMFTDENGNEDDIENDVTDGYERNLKGNESSLEQHKPEDLYNVEHGHKNLVHQFINHNKNSSTPPLSANTNTNSNNETSISNSNNHFHYHLYQYQTNHCCFNLLDHSKSSSTVTTATSTGTHENYCQSHFADKSCPLGITDISLSLNTPQSKDSEALKSINLNNFTKFNIENPTNPNSSGSEFPSTVNDMQNKLNYPSASDNTPISSCNDTSRLQTADEKIIQIELLNENAQKPQTDRDNDTCSCTKKYLPYRINEKNVWQVYETSDCKYIHSKVEIDEVFQPPATESSDSATLASENCNLLHSRSNFSNQIVCHVINHETNHNDNALHKMNETDSVNINSNNNNNKNNITQTSQKSFNTGISDNIYTPTFNIKPVNIDTCQCNIKDKYECKNNNIKYDEEDEVDNASKANNENEDEEDIIDDAEDDDVADDDESVIISNQSISTLTRETFAGRETGKLLNRPKATNNISRDQVKPVEKEIEKEITQNGMKSSSTNAFKTSSKPIRLPSPNLKQQRNNSYEDNSNESSASTDSQCESPKHIPKISSKQNSKESTPKRKSKTLMKQENKSVVIPNIHQGWSVTVAGTHPDLAPDVEMKISFPKPKGMSQSASIGPSEVSVTETQKSENEVFYYKNNQLLPPPQMSHSGDHMQYEHSQQHMQHPYEQSRPQMQYQYEQSHVKHPHYYNHRRSLSLARIDSGMSSGMVKPKSYNLPNLHVPRPTARNAFKQVQCTTISASKTIIPSRRSLSLDVGSQRRRMSYDSRSQVSPITPSEMLSVVGSEIKKTLKPKVKTMSERDLTKRHLNCFTRNNGPMF